MAQETFHDQWSPEHPVKWSPTTSDDAYLSVADAVQRIDRTMDLGGDTAGIERMLNEGQRLIGAWASYQLVSEQTA